MTQGRDAYALSRRYGGILLFALAGCGSSGGTSPPGDATDTPSPPPHELDPGPDPNPDFSSPDTDHAVLIGVADSGFRLSHESLEPRIASAQNLADPDDPDVTTSSRHGTAVASVTTLATDVHGLNLAKVNLGEEKNSYAHIMDYSVGYLADRGSRVVNHSYSGRLEAPGATSSYLGRRSIDSLHRVVTANEGRGAVYAVAAGNQGVALQADNPIHQHADIFERMLIVGGSVRNGSDEIEKAALSNYPGEDLSWQARFLTAPWRTLVALDDADDSYGWGLGTSFAVPQVSAYAAAIIETWPHLDATQVTQLLLDTADRTSPLYDDDSCGASGDVNCGYFYLGQGEASLADALAPQGELTLPSGDSVAQGGHALEASAAQLSGAYGDALATSGALADIAVFDELGRDYRTDLSDHVSQRTGRDRAMRRHMEQMATASQAHRAETRSEFGDMRFMARHNAYGEATAARLDGRFGQHAWSIFQFAGDEPNPMSPSFETGFMPMLTFQGGSDFTHDLERVTGIRHRMGLGERFSLIAEYWAGDAADDAAGLTSAYRADRSEMALAVELTERLSLTAGAGVMKETHGLLGAQGAGALAFGEDNRLHTQRIQLDYRLADTLNAFAVHETGRGGMAGSGLIQAIDDLRTRETSFGLQWQGERQQAALALRQPMHVSTANATLSVPTGRTLDGDVVREEREVSLSPSGRQRDIEFGYALLPSERTRLQLNLLYSIEPGHERDAADEIAVMVNYTRRF
ncbi:S8 family serine peptidase [Billgrantia saliphila]|uniref:S8 family serine peptidase n=1 Tax=Billgrantia saliphila TaxID=1848458 RepID=UPI000CE31361|nr:S8 family serine peptidase [Halomonas saliphila]